MDDVGDGGCCGSLHSHGWVLKQKKQIVNDMFDQNLVVELVVGCVHLPTNGIFEKLND